MKVYDLTYEQLRNFNRCSFKRLTILLLILMNICIYIVYEIENTIVSMTKLYTSILPTTYFFLDFAQPIHFAKQERVYGIFYAYTSLLKKYFQLFVGGSCLIYLLPVCGGLHSVFLVLCLVYPMLPVSLDCPFR